MAGMIGVFGSNSQNIDATSLAKTIDLASTSENYSFKVENGYLVVALLKNAPLSGSKYYENDSYIACFSGDIVDAESVPWAAILEHMAKKQYHYFASLSGSFAISVFNKREKRVVVISDRRAQYPLFYTFSNHGFAFSTTLATFCRFKEAARFNEKWLYEYFFFNFPVSQVTFLKNVSRTPPASILEYDLRTSDFLLAEYANPFSKATNLSSGKDALEKARTVFKERIPKYFVDGVTLGLSGGLDSRILLALARNTSKKFPETHTYGIPGCSDLLEASRLSQRLKLLHTGIPFNDSFLSKLHELIYETVYLSGGLQGINRSTLTYVYKTLTNNGQKYRAIVSGVSGDHLFRGHGNVPSIISTDMQRILGEGQKVVDQEFYQKVFRDNVDDFKNHVFTALANMEKRYGSMNSAASHLSYLAYDVATNYFVGEASIANNYSTFRCPYWDIHIIQLAYSICFSTLNFSKFLPAREDGFRENMLSAYLIQSNPELARLLVRGIPLRIFMINRKFLFYVLFGMYRGLTRGPGKVLSKFSKNFYPPLGDWRQWYKTSLVGNEIDQLLGKNSIMSTYVDPLFIEEIRQSRNTHWIGKLATVEIILKLIKNGWKL